MQFLPLGLVHISSESCLGNWKSVSLYRLPSNLQFVKLICTRRGEQGQRENVVYKTMGILNFDFELRFSDSKSAYFLTAK